MNRILQHLSTPLLTYAQLQSLIGSPHDPCPTCNGLDFGITHKGEWICVDCDPGRALAPKGIALSVRLTQDPITGETVAVDRDKLAEVDRATESLVRAGALVDRIHGHLWAAWMAVDGSRRYIDVDHHGPDVCVAMIASRRPVTDW